MQIWDALRRAWLKLTPEEWVRQHLIQYLIEECGALPTSIVSEFPVALGGRQQRADIVVHGPDGKPLMLAECKAPEITIDRNVFAQAVRYNSVVGARYIVVTNGMWHGIRELTPDGKYKALEEFPKF